MKIHILDGGLASDLFINGGFDKSKLNNDPLWSARVVLENPSSIKECHKRFLNAGSNVISTSTYQASVEGYMKHCGLSKEKAEEVIGSSVDLAKAAIAECKLDYDVIIAGAISPYGAILHDMSEYSGSYIDSTSYKTLKEFHKTNVQILASKGVKLFAFETMPALLEAQALVELLHDYPHCKAWLSFTTLNGTHTSYGESFTKVFQTFQDDPQVIAIGTNCCDPKFTKLVLDAAVGQLGDHQSCIAYPNNRRNSESTADECQWANDLCQWVATGVLGWVGGCCEVTPRHIKLVKEVVREFESKRVP